MTYTPETSSSEVIDSAANLIRKDKVFLLYSYLIGLSEVMFFPEEIAYV
jgi:hypothetical protein